MSNDEFIYDQLSLLESLESSKQIQGEVITSPNADITIYHNFFSKNESDKIFLELHEIIDWEQETIFLYGRRLDLPRLTAWYGDQDRFYTYSKIKMEPKPWIPILEKIKARIRKVCNEQFNSVLLNLYRDGNDSISWHSDDEKELGKNPIIGSVSFGDTRPFMFRNKFEKKLKFNVQLTHGSFLLMKGETQHYWQHQIPKTNKLV